MARDYKPRRARPASGLPGWAGALIGLVLGLAVAAFVYLKDHRPVPAVTAPAQSVKKKPRVNHPPSAATGDASAAGSYDFYKMLPNFAVVVPRTGKEIKPDIVAAPETRPGTYVLQAGSYKNFADADRIRAQLALQGIESKVQKVSVDNDTWHRIRIGPVSDLKELNRMRAILRKSNIDVLVIRVGD
ncbi:MAG: SPOR domain-containing protein [Gammaproteobacteria bacterium]|nr:SPOR domain-containing protein [Gammaproteobacteria bacterium]MDE2349180.1 SPOR domain-containing protein [Gammaproteobacteria bacterium]